MNLHQQPLNRNTNRRNSKCSYLKARTKHKARTGTNCNLNAQKQDKQHIELQKQHPELAEQAPPHEIASAALQQTQQQKEEQKESTADAPQPTPNPKQELAPTTV